MILRTILKDMQMTKALSITNGRSSSHMMIILNRALRGWLEDKQEIETLKQEL